MIKSANTDEIVIKNKKAAAESDMKIKEKRQIDSHSDNNKSSSNDSDKNECQNEESNEF